MFDTKKILYLFSGLTISLMSYSGIAHESVLAVDVGHSILRQGVLSASGKPEFEFNLALATTVTDLLSSYGHPVVRIGFDGRMVDLKKKRNLLTHQVPHYFCPFIMIPFNPNTLVNGNFMVEQESIPITHPAFPCLFPERIQQ